MFLENAVWKKARNCWKSQSSWVQPLIIVGVAVAFLILFVYRCFGEALARLLLGIISLCVGVVGLHLLYRRTKATEQRVVVEQLTRAMDQLANDNPSIRLGGIFALEQIAQSHEEERTRIVQILSDRIRELAPGIFREEIAKQIGVNPMFESLGPDGQRIRLRVARGKDFPDPKRSKDIEAAVTAMTRIASNFTPQEKLQLCDLQNTNLKNLWFIGVDFSHFNLMNTDFTLARLQKARFEKTVLGSQPGDQTYFDGANISDANFLGAKGLQPDQLKIAICEEGREPLLPDGIKSPETVWKIPT